MCPNRSGWGLWSLERIRTWELLGRHLPPVPSVVLDIGGAAGVYALPLAGQGYKVHLVDPLALHVQQARRASAEQPAASVDAVLLLGPLYHLTDRADRLQALTEVRRVLRPGGVLAAAAISRFASTMDGLLRGYLYEAGFEEIVERDVREGQHRNPTGRPAWMLPDIQRRLADPARREHVLAAIRRIETEPSLLGASSHLLAIAHR